MDDNYRLLRQTLDMSRLNGLETIVRFEMTECCADGVFNHVQGLRRFNAALDLSIQSYVLKENAGNDIIAALLKVAAGNVFSFGLLSISHRREERVQSFLLSKPQLDTLTAAEKRMLKLIAEDHTSKEIADVLNISAKTLENHRLNICYTESSQIA